MNITAIIDKHDPEGMVLNFMPGADNKVRQWSSVQEKTWRANGMGSGIMHYYTRATVEKMLQGGIEEMAEQLQNFMGKLGYFSHPDVPWRGTDAGDTVEDWNKRVFKAAVVHMLAAPSPAKEQSCQHP
jgi:hypothetical protein